jgi:hypothetical protein
MERNLRSTYLIIILNFLLSNIILAQKQDYNSVLQEQKQVVFRENFKSNTNGWPVFVNKQKAAKITVGKYVLAAKKLGFQVSPQNVQTPIPENYDLEISFKFNKGAENFFIFIVQKQQKNTPINKKKQAAIIQKLKKAYKLNQFNKITLRKINNRYSLYLNEILIKKNYAEKKPLKNIHINVTPGTIIVIDEIKLSKISLNPNGNITKDVEIVILSPITERGFLHINNSDLNKTKKNNLSISGKINPFISSAKLVLNNKPVVLSPNGEFNLNYFLQNGKNTLVFKLFKDVKLISEKQITIDYASATNTQSPVYPIVNINEKRLALVIGNANYEFGGTLANPENDAKAMAKALRNLGFEVLEQTNADQKSIKKAIDEFGKKLKAYDVGLFFYAGHGIQLKGSNYLVPIDANINSENDVEYDCVNAERVLANMEDAGSKINIVILDACRNNPFERSWTRSTQGKGLAFMNAPSGSLIAYATSPGTTASDGSGQNGLYTSALLKHLATPNITILEMFQHVRSTVMEESHDTQVPWESTSLKGNFYFAK